MIWTFINYFNNFSGQLQFTWCQIVLTEWVGVFVIGYLFFTSLCELFLEHILLNEVAITSERNMNLSDFKPVCFQPMTMATSDDCYL